MAEYAELALLSGPRSDLVVLEFATFHWLTSRRGRSQRPEMLQKMPSNLVGSL